MKLFSGSGHNSNKRTDNKHTRQAPQKGAEPKKPKKKGKGILIALLVIVVIALAMVIYWKLSSKAPDIKPPENSDNPGAVEDPGYTEERYYTMMVVGRDQLDTNTDTMMLIRFDTVENKVNVVSLPRDVVINVDREAKKINSAYYAGGNGIDSLLDEVARITGFRPNNHIVINMEVFTKVVDALGGVEFDVPIDMDYGDYALYPDGSPYEFTIDIQKGPQTLGGYDALGVFRFRQNNDGSGYAMGDIERLETQHNLMMAIAEKAMSTRNPITLFKIVESVLGNCETDLDLFNIQWYIQKFLGMSLEDIEFFTAPTTGCYVYSLTYATLTADEWIAMINETLNPYSTEIRAEDCAIMGYTGGEINSKGHMVAKEENFFCTNGEKVFYNFDSKKY